MGGGGLGRREFEVSNRNEAVPASLKLKGLEQRGVYLGGGGNGRGGEESGTIGEAKSLATGWEKLGKRPS